MSHHNDISSGCIRCSLVSFCSHDKHFTLKTKHHILKRNEVLHRPNEPFTQLYAIQRGALKTHGTNYAGKEIIHNLYLQNEVYGCDAIYNKQYVYYSTATLETVVCEISYNNFLKLLQLEPSLLELMLKLMSHQIANAAYLQFSSAQQRLCAWLVDVAERLFIMNNQEFLLPMTYQDIGNYLGLTGETVNRLFSQLRRDDIITVQHKNIRLLQLDTLKRLALS